MDEAQYNVLIKEEVNLIPENCDELINVGFFILLFSDLITRCRANTKSLVKAVTVFAKTFNQLVKLEKVKD